jgi:hypothetical protein
VYHHVKIEKRDLDNEETKGGKFPRHVQTLPGQ